MDFDLSEEQRLLKESLDRFLSDSYGFEDRKASSADPKGFSPKVWQAFAEMGLLGLPFSEADGGFGAGPVETMLVMESFGRALVVEPYLASIVLGGGLLRTLGSDEQRARLVPGLVEGSVQLAVAHTERQSRYDLHDVATIARRDGDGFVLSGEKAVVLNGDAADHILVTARTAGERRDRHGIGLFLVPADAPGLARRGMATQDGQRCADITLADVRVGPEGVLGDPSDALPGIERAVDAARAALSAEAVGAMEQALHLTVDYMKTRKQFGVAIGSFQALQHRASEMFVALEQARSMAMYAAMMAQESDARARSTAIAAAKAEVGRAAKFVGQNAIQLHGGIGMTMEYAVGHYFKRLTTIDITLGDADYHLARVAEAGDLV